MSSRGIWQTSNRNCSRACWARSAGMRWGMSASVKVCTTEHGLPDGRVFGAFGSLRIGLEQAVGLHVSITADVGDFVWVALHWHEGPDVLAKALPQRQLPEEAVVVGPDANLLIQRDGEALPMLRDVGKADVQQRLIARAVLDDHVEGALEVDGDNHEAPRVCLGCHGLDLRGTRRGTQHRIPAASASQPGSPF
eukprot:scaffold825_cov249-Pinguiococcus_pyrenoidosus.AAC.59